jgi:hypothetical protein
MLFYLKTFIISTGCSMQSLTIVDVIFTYPIYFFLSLSFGVSIIFILTRELLLERPNISLLYILLFPDYLKSKYLKYLIKNKKSNDQQNEAKKKEELGRFIKYSNYGNLLISIIIFIITCVFYSQKYWLLLGFVFWRFVSRSLEIMIAFVKDVTSKSKKSSYLDKYDRIKLATTSYIEIIIYSAAFYVTLGKNIDYIQALLLSLGTSTFTHVPFYTDAIEIKLFEKDWMYLFVYLQVLTSISLVVLSIASYIGCTDTPNQENINPPEN